MRFVSALLAILFASSNGLAAQQQGPATTWDLDPFLIVDSLRTLGAQGDWRKLDNLRSFAKAHPGSYILFVAAGSLYTLDDTAQVAEAERLNHSVERLAEQQALLAAKQAPLSARQQELGKEMQTAGLKDMGRIGAEQGKVGAEQGRIGREQGEIGRQQSVAGNTYYRRVRGMIAQCLTDHTCKQVSGAQRQETPIQP